MSYRTGSQAPIGNARPLEILAPTRYPWTFNGPRNSRHHIENRPFAPLNKISQKIEGVTVFKPWPPKKFDLIHAFNRIPIGTTPYVIGFESHLPRAYWFEHTPYYQWLIRSLASDRCRGIVAISEHARTIFTDILKDHPLFDVMNAKLQVRLPNIQIPAVDDALAESALSTVHVSFVGSHFARKGGCVAVRVAELAREAGVPLTVEIISSLEMGAAVWTDPTRADFFDRYLRLLEAPNVRFASAAPNAEVLALMRRSNFSLLTTFGDTFGFSAIESMANSTPVIGTRQGALPEFIETGEDGVLLNLPVNARGEWVHAASDQRDTALFEAMFRDEVERLALESLKVVVEALENPKGHRRMRRLAREKAVALFDHQKADVFWDAYYDKAVKRVG